tara:strand:- start:8 stop:262 length:255 start_codon:yes stop_codon:yes gene_type:complete
MELVPSEMTSMAVLMADMTPLIALQTPHNNTLKNVPTGPKKSNILLRMTITSVSSNVSNSVHNENNDVKNGDIADVSPVNAAIK